MKKNIALLILFTGISVSTYAQRTEAIVYFKDGTKQEGLGKLISQNRVKFKKTRREKPVKYQFDILDKVVINEGGDTYEYVSRVVKDIEQPRVLELLEQGGKVSLFRVVNQGYNPNMGMAGGGAGTGFGPMTGTGYYSISNYYVQRSDEDKVTHLGSTHIFSKNFKKAASDYFQDCPALVEKIQNRAFKKRDIKEIVIYYNNCR